MQIVTAAVGRQVGRGAKASVVVTWAADDGLQPPQGDGATQLGTGKAQTVHLHTKILFYILFSESVSCKGKKENINMQSQGKYYIALHDCM